MSILQEIIVAKREEVRSRRSRMPVSSLAESPLASRLTVSLASAIAQKDRFHIIAEVKKGSPSAGLIASHFDAVATARSYEQANASAISVLTDEHFFGGSLDDLRRVRESVALPLLRKDFILDVYQLHEAKAAGADAILLIAAILERQELAELFVAARELGLESLVELHHERELDHLDPTEMRLIGINNRNLADFTVDLSRSLALARLLPAGTIIVSESGIRTAADCRRLSEAGIHAALIEIGRASCRKECKA
jgi:indole-3-glycerol phosphate synthase